MTKKNQNGGSFLISCGSRSYFLFFPFLSLIRKWRGEFLVLQKISRPFPFFFLLTTEGDSQQISSIH